MKRIFIIVLATAIALAGFTFFSASQASEASEADSDEVDYENILPLSSCVNFFRLDSK